MDDCNYIQKSNKKIDENLTIAEAANKLATLL